MDDEVQELGSVSRTTKGAWGPLIEPSLVVQRPLPIWPIEGQEDAE
jgi:hypothetical protein